MPHPGGERVGGKKLQEDSDTMEAQTAQVTLPTTELYLDSSYIVKSINQLN